MNEEIIASIGLEVHVQLRTRSKMFCACATGYGEPPNTLTCPVCLGMPGALPVMNEEALRLTVLTGLMLGCEIAPTSKFDRKNYFYPDMPKNYQISQYDLPLCVGGSVVLDDLAYPKDAQRSIVTPDKRVGLVRIHLEEDVAKSTHFESSSGIDFNRAGTPLMEIVTQPDLSTPEEAFAFLVSLRQILVYGGVSDADMEKGQMRCDCNVSVRPASQRELGTKIEIKNMNSTSGVRRALAYEIERQSEVLRAGGVLGQETRRWDDGRGETFSMRTKEYAHDYRYFPDPDLLPVRTEVLVASARAQLPELPAQKRERFMEQFGVSRYDAAVLASDLDLAAYFERAAAGARRAKSVANWIINDLQSALAGSGSSIVDCPIDPAHWDALVGLVEDGKISGRQAKEVFAEMYASGKAPGDVVRERGLEQTSDRGALEAICQEVIAANPKPVEDYRAGNPNPLNFLCGQVMKRSAGKANPKIVREILEGKLGAAG